jgi:hypothetical protein
MDFRTRSKSRVLDDLVEKLRSLPRKHPDRSRLIKMIIDLNREIERRAPLVAPGGAGAVAGARKRSTGA